MGMLLHRHLTGKGQNPSPKREEKPVESKEVVTEAKEESVAEAKPKRQYNRKK